MLLWSSSFLVLFVCLLSFLFKSSYNIQVVVLVRDVENLQKGKIHLSSKIQEKKNGDNSEPFCKSWRSCKLNHWPFFTTSIDNSVFCYANELFFSDFAVPVPICVLIWTFAILEQSIQAFRGRYYCNLLTFFHLRFPLLGSNSKHGNVWVT